MFNFDDISTNVWSKWPYLQESSIGSNTDLAPSRRQAIVWNNGTDL